MFLDSVKYLRLPMLSVRIEVSFDSAWSYLPRPRCFLVQPDISGFQDRGVFRFHPVSSVLQSWRDTQLHSAVYSSFKSRLYVKHRLHAFIVFCFRPYFVRLKFACTYRVRLNYTHCATHPHDYCDILRSGVHTNARTHTHARTRMHTRTSLVNTSHY